MRILRTKVNTEGFTLVEIAVVMAIVAIVGLMMLVIFTNTLRGSNKAQVLAAIKQNGQAVLENMDKTIRGADDVACVSISRDTLVVISGGVYTRYKFTPPSGSANGYIQQDFPVQPQSGFKNDINVFLENVCTDPMGTDSLVLPQVLTDTNVQTGVSVDCVDTDCSASPIFTRNKPAGFKAQVTVMFSLKPGASVPPGAAGQIDPVTFQTTVSLR